jgi:hypothetical protein
MMGIKDQITPEQWKLLFNAPVAASTYVAMASGGGFDMIKEIYTAGKFVQDLAQQAGGSGYGELVDDLLASMTGMSKEDAKANTIQYEAKDPAAIRASAKQVVADGIAVAATLPGADGYKRWILDMARQVAETKTGGFLGIGSKSVIDEKEQAALDELAAMLGA